MTIDDLKSRYTGFFGSDPAKNGELNSIEGELGIQLPPDFREISRFYSGGILGGISHNAIAMRGPGANITDETKRLRETVGLPHSMVVLAEPPESLIVMNTKPTAEMPSVIWLDAFDVAKLRSPVDLHNPQTWPTYTDVFNYLLENEADERQGQ
jgi:hypothetical protein